MIKTNKYEENAIVTCDECGFEEEFSTDDFDCVIANMREDGWITYKHRGEWLNICPDCKGQKDK